MHVVEARAGLTVAGPPVHRERDVGGAWRPRGYVLAGLYGPTPQIDSGLIGQVELAGLRIVASVSGGREARYCSSAVWTTGSYGTGVITTWGLHGSRVVARPRPAPGAAPRG